MFDSLEEVVRDAGNWAYAVIAVIALLDAIIPIVPSETLVILGGVLASSGSLRLPFVILTAGLGAIAGDNLSYSIGRYFSRWFEAWSDRSPKRAARRAWAIRQIQERGMLLIVTARFIPGGRTIVTLTCGATREPWPKFFFATVVAGAIWATYASLLGFIGGEVLEHNHTLAFVIAFVVALTVSAMIELVRHWLKKRRGEGDLAEAQPPASSSR